MFGWANGDCLIGITGLREKIVLLVTENGYICVEGEGEGNCSSDSNVNVSSG